MRAIVQCEQANGVYYIDIQMHAMFVRLRFLPKPFPTRCSLNQQQYTFAQYAISTNIRDTRLEEITETYHSASKQ